MPRHVNSASRLFAISEKVAATRDDAKTLDMWIKIFGLVGEQASAIEVCRRLIWINEEIDLMLVQMGATHFSEHLYLKPAQGMRSAVAPTAMHGNAQAIKGSMSEPVRTGMEFCADALPDEEAPVDPESINELKSLITELRDMVAEAGLPDYLRHLVQRHIDLLQRALDALPIKGLKALTEATLAASGQLVCLTADVREDESRGDVDARKAVAGALRRTWTRVGKTVDAAVKVQKGLGLGYAAYKVLEHVLSK